MNSLTIALLTFCGVFSCALFGMFLSKRLPGHHLDNESRDTVKVTAALIATMVAIVLGMLVSSAKASFDEMNSGLADMGAKIIQLDQALAHYGPETKEIRDSLRDTVVSVIKTVWPEDVHSHPDLAAIEKSNATGHMMIALRKLQPLTDDQRELKAQALQISSDLSNLRWTMIERWHKSLPWMVLLVLAFWLAILFTSFGLFARRNATVVTALCLSALSVSGAVLLIMEMNSPLTGMIKASPDPLYKALEFIGK